MGKLHFITYANGKGKDGYEFSNTQRLMIESIQSKTSKEVVFHTHNLETISKKEWFKYIKDLPLINRPSYIRRDGYYCAYKIFLTKEVCYNFIAYVSTGVSLFFQRSLGC